MEYFDELSEYCARIENGEVTPASVADMERVPATPFLDAVVHAQYMKTLTTPGNHTGWISHSGGGRYSFALLNSRTHGFVILCKSSAGMCSYKTLVPLLAYRRV